MNGVRAASAIVVAVGLIALAVAYFQVQSRLETIRNWKPVDAQVIRIWMEEHRSGASSEQSTSYSAHYELAYNIDGKPIRTTAQSEDVFLGEPQAVQARLNRHGPGTRGVVYANPEDPKQVRLNLGRNVNTFAWPLWLLLAGGSMLLIGISLWFMGTPAVYW